MLYNRLKFLYGKKQADKYNPEIIKLIKKYKPKISKSKKHLFSEKDVVLITYGDSLLQNKKLSLKILNKFYSKYLKKIINTIHILPFFPYSSDDGFSVIDYYKVNPCLGKWKHIKELNENVTLMFDLVLNHISAKSKWFCEYLKSNKKYKDYFIAVESDTDISKVVRPRALPLLTEFDVEYEDIDLKKEKKYIWTTFSADQVDLNFSNPKVLIEMINVFLFFVSKGARIIRLDAIAYLWKKAGTECIHLPETHEVVKIFRDIVVLLKADVIILTETNVPHEQNLSYFGNGQDEAHMIYQFSLPPLLSHAILRQDSSYLCKWVKTIKDISNKSTYFNFTASHDGIGVLPAKTIISDKEINFLAETVKQKGGYVSYKDDNGKKVPYELNINYLDFINNLEDSNEIKAKRFMVSQAVMLSLKGMPGIYIHSLLGSRNYEQGVKETGKPRSINREKLEYNKVVSDLKQTDSLRCLVFSKYYNLLKIRKKYKAFNPSAGQKIIDTKKEIFCMLRTSVDKKQNILVCINISDKQISQEVDLNEIIEIKKAKDVVLNNKIEFICNKITLSLNPFQISWIVLK
jgi:glucosylglycerate phosphorylase